MRASTCPPEACPKRDRLSREGGVAGDGAQKGEKRLRRLVGVPEITEPTEQYRPTIQHIPFAEVPERSHPGALRLLREHVLLEDRLRYDVRAGIGRAGCEEQANGETLPRECELLSDARQPGGQLDRVVAGLNLGQQLTHARVPHQ